MSGDLPVKKGNPNALMHLKSKTPFARERERETITLIFSNFD
jgi:hypothetical protein